MTSVMYFFQLWLVCPSVVLLDSHFSFWVVLWSSMGAFFVTIIEYNLLTHARLQNSFYG